MNNSKISTKIKIKADCGNSPKMNFLKEINIAFAESNLTFLSDHVTDSIEWNIVGEKLIVGKESFTDELEVMKSNEISELVLQQVLSHGREGAARGIITMNNGKMFAFSDFYEFNNSKGSLIKSITSFVVEL